MKKIKKISIRLSQKDYELLVNDYMFYINNPDITRLLYKQEIRSFSDYIRLMINKGIND